MTGMDAFLSFVKFLKTGMPSLTVNPVIRDKKNASSDLLKESCINVIHISDEFDDVAWDTAKRLVTIGVHVIYGSEAEAQVALESLLLLLDERRAYAYLFSAEHRSGELVPSRYIDWDERVAASFRRIDSDNLARWFNEFDVRYSRI